MESDRVICFITDDVSYIFKVSIKYINLCIYILVGYLDYHYIIPNKIELKWQLINYTNLRWCTSKDNMKNRQNSAPRDMGIKILETDEVTGATKIYKNKVKSLTVGYNSKRFNRKTKRKSKGQWENI